jgi:hypothetical protein
MMDRLMDSPIPIPLGFVVKKASNIRSMFCGSVPAPESLTATRTLSVPHFCEITIRWSVCRREDSFASVHDQVQDHLLQLNSIALHGR